MPIPQIAGYNLSVQQNGTKVFRSVPARSFIPFRTVPIKIYIYGSGMFAVVFKIQINNSFHAVRCFLDNRVNIDRRYKCIIEYLGSLSNVGWKVNCSFLENEFLADGKYQPIVLMDWIDGQPINKYVTRNINNKEALSDLQLKILKVSESLTDNGIGHGDLQYGNMIIDNRDESLKLIDYDGLYVPLLRNQQCVELGRPEYQHPRRTAKDLNERVDWFSVWIFLTALEAVKAEPGLWNLAKDKGFNTLENFLFVGEDFQRPQHSALFKKLLDIDNEPLNYYTRKLLSFCEKDVSSVERPALFPQNEKPQKNSVPNNSGTSSFTIDANIPAVVLSQQFRRIANTPCKLDKDIFSGKKVIISYGNKTKILELDRQQEKYFIEFN